MHTDVDEGPEVGDVGHNARQYHALHQIVHAGDIGVKLKFLNLFAGVTTWFLQLFHDVGQCRHTYRLVHIVFEVDFFPF